MVKADDKVSYEEGEQQKYTYFEELTKRVEQLQRIVDMHADILKQHNLRFTEKIEAYSFDEEELYEDLEEEGE